jgi:hypothetical protein
MVIARRGVFASVVVYSLVMFSSFTVALLGHEVMGRKMSGVDLVPAIDTVLTDNMPLYGVAMLDHTLPFYLRHPLVMVLHPDELEFGIGQEPQKWYPTLEGFAAKWKDGQHAVAIMSPRMYKDLAQQGLPMYKLGQDARRVAVSNFPPPNEPATAAAGAQAAVTPAPAPRAP